MKVFSLIVVTLLLFSFVYAGGDNVTFRCNMKVKDLKGTWDPAHDILLVQGNFNSWTSVDTLTDPDLDSIYTKTITFNADSTLQFKFVYFDSHNAFALSYENDFASPPGIVGHRVYTIPPGGGSFTAYYNDDSVANPTEPMTLYFTLDMGLERASGRFNPATETVYVRGSFNGWGTSTVLSQNGVHPDLYDGEIDNFPAAVGDLQAFKFYYQPSSWENGFPTTSGNREYHISADDFANGYVVFDSAFNNSSLSTVLNQPATVKFTVYTLGAISSQNSSPFPSVDTVWVTGAVSPLSWPNSGWPDSEKVRMIKLYDDGSHGDVTAGDHVFSADLQFPIYTILNFDYKYGMNFAEGSVKTGGGNDNENGFGVNHHVSLTTSTFGIVIVDTFGIMGAARYETGSNVVTLAQDWNLVSVPRGVADFSKLALYPTSNSYAFGYNHGYVTTDPLKNGSGYWIKVPAVGPDTIRGNTIPGASIPVNAGWNMIGGISCSVPIANIGSTPPGIVTSQFFAFAGGYNPAVNIDPGQGYWVKVSSSGYLNLSCSNATTSGLIRIVPTNERPPAPPEVSATDPKPTTYALNQNYPNPFNPVTQIQYQLPTNGNVTLRVYNILGAEIATLVNGYQEAGYKTIQFDASNLPSGVYFYQIHAGTFNDLKKMVIMK